MRLAQHVEALAREHGAELDLARTGYAPLTQHEVFAFIKGKIRWKLSISDLEMLQFDDARMGQVVKDRFNSALKCESEEVDG